MTNVDSLLKRRVITLLTKVHLVKAMVFPVVMLEMGMATNSSILAWRIPGTGAWWAAVYGVTQSRTRLKRLSSSSRPTFVSKVMSLLFSMLSRLVIAILPRSKRLLISWLQSPSAMILETKKIKSLSFHCFPFYLPCSNGTKHHHLRFLNVEF